MPVQPEKRSGDPQVRIAAKEHPVVSLSAGRITVMATVVRAGADLCIVLTGGDRPHIGTVTLSVPRPSLADSARTSATTSILNCTGHKDGEAAQYLGQRLAATLGATVVARMSAASWNSSAKMSQLPKQRRMQLSVKQSLTRLILHVRLMMNI